MATIVSPSGSAVKAMPFKGGAVVLSPADVTGGRRRRMTKKMRKMLKALKKVKGGVELEGEKGQGMSSAEEALGAAPEFSEEGGRRRRRGSRKTRRGRKSRRGFFA